MRLAQGRSRGRWEGSPRPRSRSAQFARGFEKCRALYLVRNARQKTLSASARGSPPRPRTPPRSGSRQHVWQRNRRHRWTFSRGNRRARISASSSPVPSASRIARIAVTRSGPTRQRMIRDCPRGMWDARRSASGSSMSSSHSQMVTCKRTPESRASSASSSSHERNRKIRGRAVVSPTCRAAKQAPPPDACRTPVSLLMREEPPSRVFRRHRASRTPSTRPCRRRRPRRERRSNIGMGMIKLDRDAPALGVHELSKYR